MTALAQSTYEPYTFTTLAGQAGSSGSVDGTGSAALFNEPQGLAVDSAGNLYVADSRNYTIRKVTPAGVVTTVAGLAGSYGDADGTASAARFGTWGTGPQGVAVDIAGNVYVADSGNSTIRKITSAGVVSTLSTAWLNSPQGITVDAAGSIYVAVAAAGTIRKITPEGVDITLAGSAGQWGSADGQGSAARFFFPYGIGVDGAGNVYVGDSGNSTIRKITPDGVVSTLAGQVRIKGSVDGKGSAARFDNASAPTNSFTNIGLAMDGAGNVYVADSGNCTIRKITPDGVVRTVAGLAGVPGSADGTGSAVRFGKIYGDSREEKYVVGPQGVTVDRAGNIYVADTSNHTIRKGWPANPPADVPPMITTNPVSQSVLAGTTATFNVIASGTSLFGYQWLFNGIPIVGQTNSTLTLSNVQSTEEGNYTVAVFNAAGAVTSQIAVLTLAPDLSRGPLDSWTHRASGTGNPLPTTNNLTAIAYGNNQFVVVESSGETLTSPDGINWTSHNSGATSLRNGIAYGNNEFVTVSGDNGLGGTIMTSPDGITWTSRLPELMVSDLDGIAYGNNQFVAVGGDYSWGTILTSPDGIQWTSRTSGTRQGLMSIAYENNEFVAVGSGGTILTSSDGITWTSRTSGTTNGLTSIAYGYNEFVAVGSGGTILTSLDGITWTSRASGTGYAFSGIAYGKNIFVAVGEQGTILASPDGITWTRSIAGTYQPLYSIVYGNNAFVAVGGRGTILTSPDGITWASRISGTTSNLRAIAYGNDGFVAVGDLGTILTSPDGITWASRTSGTTNGLASIAYGNNAFVAAGQEARYITRPGYWYFGPWILRSIDGINWASPISNPGGGPIGAITYGNNRFVAVGHMGTFLNSPDGITWTNFTVAQYWYLNGIACGPHEFAAVGYGGPISGFNNGGLILTSTNAISWTIRNSKTANCLRAIAYGNDGYVAVGDSGTILTSPNGITWTGRTSGSGNGLFGVAFGNNTFVAVGLEGTILQSATLNSAVDPVISGHLNNGGFELTIAGITGQTYGIQWADDLSGHISWQTLGTLTLTNSSSAWHDATASNRSQRFYRAIILP